jgi:hypothetical protein
MPMLVKYTIVLFSLLNQTSIFEKLFFRRKKKLLETKASQSILAKYFPQTVKANGQTHPWVVPLGTTSRNFKEPKIAKSFF